MPPHVFATYHLWLLVGNRSPGPAIVLHGDPAAPARLGADLARYLNEFDDEAQGSWTSIAPGLPQQIALNPEERALLGVPPPCPGCPPGSACCQRRVLTALARRGHVVLEGPLAFQASLGLEDIFRATLGVEAPDPSHVHLALRPELFGRESLPSIIGDTFLGWQSRGHDLRTAIDPFA